MTESILTQETIHASAKVEHPITKDIKEWEEVNYQDELYSFTNSFVFSDNIL